MSRAERGAVENAQAIAGALDGADIPHAIGGALALAIAGVPRGTADVDINVFVPIDQVLRVVGVLVELGVDIVPEEAESRARRDGMFVGRWNGMRIDVFLPSIPFAWEASRTRSRVTDADGWSGWFLAPEALAVFKLLFFRGKDLVDLERLLAVNRGRLDTAYVRRWTVDMMGEEDERVRRWDDLVSRFG